MSPRNLSTVIDYDKAGPCVRDETIEELILISELVQRNPARKLGLEN